MADEEARTPIVEYSDDKKDPDHYVKILVDIPGIKKKLIGDEASNAEVNFKCEERSFALDVKIDGKHYLYKINKLPAAIVTEPKKSYYKVKKDTVTLNLCKVQAGSWAGYLAKGLEAED